MINLHKHIRNIIAAKSLKRFICNRGDLQITTMPHGLNIVTEITRSPLACIALFAKVGSRYENGDINGLTHFIEHLAYSGFSSMDKEAFATHLNDMGVRMNAFTTREFQAFTAICPSNCASEIVQIFAKIVTDLALCERDIESEKKTIADEMQQLDCEPKAVVFDYLNEAAFQGTPLAQRVIGPSKNLKKFNRECVYHFIKNNYIASRLVLVTSGYVSHSQIADCACQCFANIPCAGLEACSGPSRFTGSSIIYRDDSMPFAHVTIAVEAPGLNSDDYLPLMVAKNVVGSWHRSQGGYHRHASFLARAASSGIFCDKFESFYETYSDVGLWGIYFVSPLMKTEGIVHNLHKIWLHICYTITKNEVERAINLTRLELRRNVEGSVNSCLDIGKQIMLKNERTSLSTQLEKLSKINVKVIKEIGDKYLYHTSLVVSAMGPTETLPAYVRLQSGQYWLRL